MPNATFTHEVHVSRSQDEVWSVLQDPASWEAIGPVQDVWDPEHDDEGTLLGYSWATSIGGKQYDGTGETREHDRPSRFVIDLDAGEMAGTISVNLESGNPGGTDLKVDLDVRSQGMLSSVFFPAIRQAIGSGFPDQMDSFAAKIDG